MRPIDGNAKSVRELLKDVKYSIDYYQREYRWATKQVRELIEDLTNTFLSAYEQGMSRAHVRQFPHYFLGSIIVSKRDNENFIVDGQQRLTTLTLLLMLLRDLQRGRDDAVNIDDLIFSAKYGEKSFNLVVEDREECMVALFDGTEFDPMDHSESVQNLYERYQDMESLFPVELREEPLPFIIDWTIDNVNLVEITAYSDEESYRIFETMNDRGLSLSPTEMLKGYLLSNMDEERRPRADDLWRSRILELGEKGDEHGSNFFKSWLRSNHAMKIRERHKGAVAEDFERIGTEFHRWVRNKQESLGLKTSDHYFKFVKSDFDFYSKQCLRIREAQEEPVPGLEHVYYNATLNFTLQEMLLLAPLRIDDSEADISVKLTLVARYIDIVLAWRIWNFRSISYSTMQYTMFRVVREIRHMDVEDLAHLLHQMLLDETETLETNTRLRVHQQNRYAIHRLLARLTDYVETESRLPSRYVEYLASGRYRYEIEHVWADHPERHEDEFDHPADFAEHRNRIGGLLLLPKTFNASYGDLPYDKKRRHYNTQNLLARTLCEEAYEHNPGFVDLIRTSDLPFRPIELFGRSDLEERGELYRQIAECIWNPDDLLEEIDR